MSLQITELRVGNFLKNKNLIDVIRVGTINVEGSIWLNYGIFKNVYTDRMSLSGFEGVALTIEWIEKFGFELFPWGYVKDGLLIRCSFKKDGVKFWFEVGNGLKVDIKFVHQLQNLFFAMKGSELDDSKY
ncbi:MAG: hypothetical protein C4K58_06850 [Flavobacteriaceae bacterium]|nr:MAG: hypothetical protein C4K58_06850 [Flavobacteriaceae bacterium]